jgi:tRNA threonylcarbamoyladenosine biosynthesis protein TsaB
LPGRTASERLLGTVRELTKASGAEVGSLDAVVVVHGPGSFTGVRVGLSAAKGLCEAVGARIVAISRLAVLAEVAVGETGLGDRPVHALLDAGRGEFYYGEYDGGACLRESLLTRDEVIAAVKGRGGGDVVVACEAGAAQSLGSIEVRLVADPVAGDALGLAMRRIGEGKFDDVAAIDANYVRRTAAEIFAKPKAAAEDAQVLRGQHEMPER